MWLVKILFLEETVSAAVWAVGPLPLSPRGDSLMFCALTSVWQSYQDFHSDLFPDTASGIPALSADSWFKGENQMVSQIFESQFT